MAKILLADDNDAILESFREILELKGHKVTVALDGAKALECFSLDSPDLLITDIFMPEKDGLTVIEEVHRQSPDIPIIAISAGNPLGKKDVFLDLARQNGASYTFLKPVDIEKLLATISELVKD